MKRAKLPAFLSAVTIALFLGACTPPPTGTVSGYVVNRKAGTPVEGTSVQAEGSGQSAVTDASGFYSLEVPAGTVTLLFTQSGYAASRAEGVRVGANEETHYSTVQAEAFDSFLPTEAPRLDVSLQSGNVASVDPDSNTFSFTVTGSVAAPEANGFAFASAGLSHSLGNSGTLNAFIPGTPIALGEDGTAEVALSAAGFDGETTLHIVAYDQNNNRTELIRYITVESTLAAADPAPPTDLSGLAVTFGDTSVFGPLKTGQGHTGRELLDAFGKGDASVLVEQAALMREAKGQLGAQGFLDEAVTWVDLSFAYPLTDTIVTRADLAAAAEELPAAFEVFRTLAGGEEVSIGRIDAFDAAIFVDQAGTEDPSDDLLTGFGYRDATPGLQAGLEASYRVEAVTGDKRESSSSFKVTPQPPFYVTADSPADGATGVSVLPTYEMSFENRSDVVLFGVLVLDRVQAEDNIVEWFACCGVDDTGATRVGVLHNSDGTASTAALQPFHSYDWAPAALTADGSFANGTFSDVTSISIAADFFLLGAPLGGIFDVDLGAQDGPVNTFLTGDGSQ